MKKLLVVDDEKNFLLSLADMFKHYSDRYVLFTAFNGKEAIEILEREEIDLVVTDLKMPELDGFGLLAHMIASNPDTPVIVMTAFATPENTNRLDTLGLYQYIEKPIEFRVLHEKIEHALKNVTHGHVAGVSLASFLQLVGLDNKTCTLRITSDNRVGICYFKDGDLLDSIFDDMAGEEAAIEISGWHPVEIDIEESCRKNDRVIDSPLGFILIEGARRKDEKAAAAAQEKENHPASPEQPEINSSSSDDIFIDLAYSSDVAQQTTGEQVDILGNTIDAQEVNKEAQIALTVEKIGAALRDALGPVSDMILRDTIESWEKSGNRHDRLNELVDALCMEIGDSRMEISFRSAIKPFLLESGITPANSISSSPSIVQKTSNSTDNQALNILIPKIKKAFAGTIGPIGDVLIKETVEKWSQKGPASMSRLDELVDLLCTEIDDVDLEHFFRLKISKLL